MPANNTCWIVHYWQGLYGQLGHLYGPDRFTQPMPHIPYALDNGAFGAFTNGIAWCESKWIRHLEKYSFLPMRPAWAIVPDVVADRATTLNNWKKYAPVMQKDFNLVLAVAVQDGMSVDDVRNLNPIPELVFVGGSTGWKWATVNEWCSSFARVHVGRVNTLKHLRICREAGAESCDGTGWFRGRKAQILELGKFLSEQAGLDDDEGLERIVDLSRVKVCTNGTLPHEFPFERRRVS